MAARLNPRHSDLVRQKIQAGVLIDRLQKHVSGDVEMTGTQVTAALGLLDRSVAKLQSIQVSGPDDGPIQHLVTWQQKP
jgi:predicted regulator of amino acid metabolism with ACT domain